MSPWAKVAIGVAISGAVVGVIYLASRPSAPTDASGNVIPPPDSIAGANLPVGGNTDTQVIANGITNVIGRAIDQFGQSYRSYNEQQAGLIRNAQNNAANGGAVGGAQAAARQNKINGAR